MGTSTVLLQKSGNVCQSLPIWCHPGIRVTAIEPELSRISPRGASVLSHVTDYVLPQHRLRKGPSLGSKRRNTKATTEAIVLVSNLLELEATTFPQARHPYFDALAVHHAISVTIGRSNNVKTLSRPACN